jgi:hypothetical protein
MAGDYFRTLFAHSRCCKTKRSGRSSSGVISKLDLPGSKCVGTRPHIGMCGRLGPDEALRIGREFNMNNVRILRNLVRAIMRSNADG